MQDSDGDGISDACDESGASALVSSWEVIQELSDEFNGSELDLNKWDNKDSRWVGRHPSYFEPANISLVNGELNLKSRLINSQDTPPTDQSGYTHAAVAVKSKVKVRYGYFEVRAKAESSGFWNSFWFYDETPAHWTEIDVFEIAGSNDYLVRTAHLFKNTGYEGTVNNHIKSQEEIFYPASYDVTEYHTYGLNWNQDEITWYVDGEEVYSTENEHWHQKLHMMFDTEITYWPGIPDAAKLPATFKIEYIRSWKSL